MKWAWFVLFITIIKKSIQRFKYQAFIRRKQEANSRSENIKEDVKGEKDHEKEQSWVAVFKHSKNYLIDMEYI